MTWRPYAVLGDPDSAGPFVFTCEHASNDLPPGLVAGPEDEHLLDDHWGWDIGTRNVVAGLVAELGGQGVVCGTSRLVVDANRLTTAPSYIVRDIGGHELTFNLHLTPEDIAERTSTCFDAYHDAIREVGERRQQLPAPFHLVSIHSFTPSLHGATRPMEIGILFDDFDEDVDKLAASLHAQGFVVALNEPYSGRGPGALIYAANRHGKELGVKYLELELRQDLVDTEVEARAVARRLAAGLSAFAPEGHE